MAAGEMIAKGLAGTGKAAESVVSRGSTKVADLAAANTAPKYSIFKSEGFKTELRNAAENKADKAIFPQGIVQGPMTEEAAAKLSKSEAGALKRSSDRIAKNNKPGMMDKATSWMKNTKNTVVDWAKANPGMAWTAGGVTAGGLWLYGNHLNNQDAALQAQQEQGQY